jgi:hypothetical protein
MNSNNKMSYDYQTGFSRFKDGSKFKYNDKGDICLATDCSNWAKRLLHDVPLSVYFQVEELNPSTDFLTFPEFGELKRKKKGQKETVGNYIEDCEHCGKYMEKTFRFYGKLVCSDCKKNLQKQNCDRCGEKNMYVDMFIEDCDSSFEQRFMKTACISSDIYFYCNNCIENLSQVYSSYFTGTSSWDHILEGIYLN